MSVWRCPHPFVDADGPSEPPYVAASLLAADAARLAEEAQAMQQAGTDWLHVDVMDGHYVPNMAFGPQAVAALHRACTLALDVHLMVQQPARWVRPFADAGAAMLTFHPETTAQPGAVIDAIRAAGVRVGISLHPDLPVQEIEPWLPHVDLVLVMSVRPGFGGQAFLAHVPATIEALCAVRKRRGLRFVVEVDGGIKPQTARQARLAGADALVAGTALFGAGNQGASAYADALAALRRAAQTPRG